MAVGDEAIWHTGIQTKVRNLADDVFKYILIKISDKIKISLNFTYNGTVIRMVSDNGLATKRWSNVIWTTKYPR